MSNKEEPEKLSEIFDQLWDSKEEMVKDITDKLFETFDCQFWDSKEEMVIDIEN